MPESTTARLPGKAWMAANSNVRSGEELSGRSCVSALKLENLSGRLHDAPLTAKHSPEGQARESTKWVRESCREGHSSQIGKPGARGFPIALSPFWEVYAAAVELLRAAVTQ